MRIYIVTCESFPVGMAASARIGNYARALKACGVDVKVVIAKRTEVYGRKPANVEADGLFHDIPFHYVSGTPLRSRGLLMRRLRDLLDVFSTIRFLGREMKKGDALIGYFDGHPFLVYCLLGWCHKHGVRYISELCEYPYETGAKRPPFLEKRFVIHRLFPLFDGVIAISDPLADFARKHCKASCSIGKIPILVDFERYRLDDLSAGVNPPYIFHCGTLYDKKDGFSGMLDAFGRVVREKQIDAMFVTTGSISDARDPERVLGTIEKWGISERVRFVGYVTESQKAELLAGAALVIINKPDNLQNRCCFSTKLGEYLAAGKPVIHTSVGEAMNFLKDGENARIVPPGDSEALSIAITELLEHRDAARRMGEAGRSLCRSTFDFRCNGEKILEAVL